MSDPKAKLERNSKKMIKKEHFIWLTTVDSEGRPQTRPVWFIWDNNSFLIYSQPKAYKLQHIKHNDNVSLNFNSDETGEKDVMVYIGKAAQDNDTPPANKVPAYIRKYRKGIKEIGMTPDKFGLEYSVAIRVKPTSLRGW